MAYHLLYSGKTLTTADPDPDGDWSVGILFIVIQVFSSCFAGVYNEFLLKKKGAEVRLCEREGERMKMRERERMRERENERERGAIP